MAICPVVDVGIFDLLLQEGARAFFGLVVINKVDDALGIGECTVVASTNVATVFLGTGNRSQETEKEEFHHAEIKMLSRRGSSWCCQSFEL